MIPQRSVLYTIEPINKYSVNVESLHHYLYRLSNAHCMNLTTFLKEIVLNRDIDEIRINSFKTQELISNALEHLTSCNDISLTTFLYYKNTLSDIRLFRQYHAWCPLCLLEIRNKRQLPYEKLIWTITSIKCCIIHHINLVDKCGFCGNRIESTYGYGKDVPYGYCRKCNTFLGDAPNSSMIKKNDLHRSEKIISLLLHRDKDKLPLENSLYTLFKDSYHGDLCSLSNSTSIPISKLRRYILESTKPSLDVYLILEDEMECPFYKLLDNRYFLNNETAISVKTSINRKKMTEQDFEINLQERLTTIFKDSFFDLQKRGFDNEKILSLFSKTADEFRN